MRSPHVGQTYAPSSCGRRRFFFRFGFFTSDHRTPGRIAIGEELELDDVRVTAHGAVLDVALLHPCVLYTSDAAAVTQRRADVRASILQAEAIFLSFRFLHECFTYAGAARRL